MTAWIRTRVLPGVVWTGTMIGAAWLWTDVHSDGVAVGFASGVEYTVATAAIGRIDSLAVVPGQHVRAGQVVAVLASDALDAEQTVLDAEHDRLAAELAAVAADGAVRNGNAARLFDESVAAADLALQTARADRRVRAAEYAALATQTEAVADLVARRMADRRELDALKVKRAALKKELDTSDGLIRELVRQAEAARARRDALPVDATELAMRPVRADMSALAGRQRVLAVRREDTVLRAPADGLVAAVHVRPGEIAAPGVPVVTLVDRGPEDDDVHVCLREGQAPQLRIGEAVSLRARMIGGPALAGHVTRIGPTIAELPLRCRRDPGIPEWGREVSVALDERAALVPGQSFSVAFLGRQAPCAADDTYDPLALAGKEQP